MKLDAVKKSYLSEYFTPSMLPWDHISTKWKWNFKIESFSTLIVWNHIVSNLSNCHNHQFSWKSPQKWRRKNGAGYLVSKSLSGLSERALSYTSLCRTSRVRSSSRGHELTRCQRRTDYRTIDGSGFYTFGSNLK